MQFVFEYVNFFVNLLHYVVSKLLLFLRAFFPWLLENRIEFEQLNDVDRYAKSFRKDGLQADLTLEVSSQGEFQQVHYLLNQLLSKGKRIELIYASPSLEGDINQFKQKHSINKLRVLRLPIIKIGFMTLSSWMTSSKFLFVRYDFYPHLITAIKKKKMKKILVWGSLKNKMKNPFSKWYWKNLAQFFDIIFCATDETKKEFKKLNPEAILETSEMRIFAIQERYEARKETFEAKNIRSLVEDLQSFKGTKLILGSAYIDDLDLLCSIKKQILDKQTKVIIAPHHLSKNNVEEFSTRLREEYGDVFNHYQDEQDSADHSILMMTTKGVLCELYCEFDYAYVGGGFEKSIHSVLEPFWGNCQVLCGPKTHRSTEIDFCLEAAPNQMIVFQNRNDASNWLSEALDRKTLKKDNNRTHLDELLMKEKMSAQKLIGMF